LNWKPYIPLERSFEDDNKAESSSNGSKKTEEPIPDSKLPPELQVLRKFDVFIFANTHIARHFVTSFSPPSK
jgi:hypothetical protein